MPSASLAAVVRPVAIGAVIALQTHLALAQSTVTYTYDELGRVTSAVTSPSGKKVVYAYDAAGNRTLVGNGVTYAEIFPTGFSASTTLSGSTGLTLAAMKDAVFDTRASSHVTQSEATPWVQADLGTAKNVDHIDIAAALDTPWGVGPWNLNTSKIEYSTNGTTWSTAATVTGVVPGTYATIRLGGVLGRYFRIKRPTTGQLAIGDIRFFSSDDTSNGSPLAAADSAVANGGAAVLIDVLANDTDPENDPLSISSYTSPAHGSITPSGSQLSYQPTGGYAGADSFTYTVSDGKGATAVATVSLTVNAATNAAPIAVDDSVTTPAYMHVTFNPRTNDSDPNGNPLTIVGVGSPSHGTAVVNNGTSVTYTPAPAYVGADSFLYTISDGKGGAASATITATMTAGNPAMLAVIDPTNYASAVNISGATFNVPTNGTANVYVNRPMTTGKWYWEVKLLCGVLSTGVTPDIATARTTGGYSNYNGGVYTYSPMAWPSLTAVPAWGATAAGDVFGFAFNANTRVLKVYKNNIPGPALTLTSANTHYPFSGVQPGFTTPGQTCANTASMGRFIFGPETTYSPPIGYAHLASVSSNNAPVAVNDSRMTLPNTANTLDPRINDNDPEGESIAITAVGSAAHGTVVINSGASVTYTPSSGYSGSDSFTYTVTDPQGLTATATVSMTVTSSAMARGFSISPAFNGKTSWGLDVDGPLTFSTAGSWTIVANSTFQTNVKAWGAGGGGGNGGNHPGAGGGYAAGLTTLQSGVSYVIYVGAGGQPGTGSATTSSPAAGGAPGGGGGYSNLVGSYYVGGGGGGGYSGVRKSAGTSIILAGGGGGAGSADAPLAGGGTTGQTNIYGTYQVGTQTTPGMASTPGSGSALTGGVAYDRGYGAPGGGGGGAGHYGGGGGVDGYSGGGGSGYVHPTDVSGTTLTAGVGRTPGNDTDPDRGGAGLGGAMAAGGGGAAGRVKMW